MRHGPRLVTSALLAVVALPDAQPPSGGVVVEKNVEARMRDGVDPARRRLSAGG